MSTAESDQLLEFQGKDIEECEKFIAAVNRHARDNGKLRDDQWIADFVAVCLSGDALIWWSLLDENVQGSWRLLRKEMISQSRPIFYGRSGSEAEGFVHQVRRRALHVGRLNDLEWCAEFASGCFAGNALRWYSLLDSSVTKDWEKLQRAIFKQYDDGAEAQLQSSLIPTAPSAAAMPTRWKGRLQVRRLSDSECSYVSREFCSATDQGGRLMATKAAESALELEYDSALPSTLFVPRNQLDGYDTLGLHWKGDDLDEPDFLAVCGVDSKNGTGSAGPLFEGALLTTPWKISGLTTSWRETAPVTATDASGKRLWTYLGAGPRAYMWFRDGEQNAEDSAELFFEFI